MCWARVLFCSRSGSYSPYYGEDLRQSNLDGGGGGREIGRTGDNEDGAIDETQRYSQARVGGGDVARRSPPGTPLGILPPSLAGASGRVGMDDVPKGLSSSANEPTPPYRGGVGRGVGEVHEIGMPGKVTLAPRHTHSSSTPPLHGSGAGGGFGSVSERLAEFRETKVMAPRVAGGGRGGSTNPLLPSPPASADAPQRRGLLDEKLLYASGPGIANDTVLRIGNKYSVGGVREGEDGGLAIFNSVSTASSANDSVSEKLRNIHNAFATLRSQQPGM